MCGQESHIHFSLRHVTGSLSFIFQLLKENGGMVVNSDIYARQISFIFCDAMVSAFPFVE